MNRIRHFLLEKRWICFGVGVLITNIGHTQVRQKYPVISYLDIPVDSIGHLPRNPYVLALKNNQHQLIVIGTEHTQDTLSTQFSEIEQHFYNLKPEIIINEGGSLTKKYRSRNDAITRNGELGLEKYLADLAGIKTVNGDMPDKLEFEELSFEYSKGQALFYFATERFMFPYAFGQYPGSLEQQYDSVFINQYMLKEGIELSSEERSFSYYKNEYKKYFGAEFSLDSLNQLDFTPFSKRNHFNQVSRSSKGIRDQYLLSLLNCQLAVHKRVMLVFGGWHILSIEPSLRTIMQEKDKN